MIKTWILSFWDSFRSSLWFVPTVMTLGAVMLAAVVPRIDGLTTEYVVENLPWLVSTSASARSALGAMAGAMVTVSGVVLSITVVALSMTSSQFGPRLLRTFMSNTSTQVALGMFIATSMYCLLVLREVRGGPEDEQFVPHISVSLGVLMSVASIGVLIYFIHEVAMSVQAPRVVQIVSNEIDAAINRLYPATVGEGAASTDGHGEVVMQVAALGEDFNNCKSEKEGYLQAVEAAGIVQLAVREDVVIQLLQRPGAFVVRDAPLARVWPRECDLAKIEAELNDQIIVGYRRTPRQDAKCAILEMVEVAVRALSPGVNDPFTAMNCIDRLAASLTRLAKKQCPSPFRRDDDGRLRVIAESPSFDELLNCAFDQIRRHGEGDVALMERLLAGLRVVHSAVITEQDRESVLRQVQMIQRSAERSIAEVDDRASLLSLCEHFASSKDDASRELQDAHLATHAK